MQEKILIIEDEPSIQSILRELLSDAGYNVRTAGDGEEGLMKFRQEEADLVLLDIMLPKLDGYAVCRALREASAVPVIMLTALDEEASQVRAFELQADDYITKPFSIKLVLLRVEAVLRRNRQRESEAGSGFKYGNVRLDTEARRVYNGENEIYLTKIEYDLLKTFFESPGRVFTRDNLLNIVWGYDFAGDEKAVNIHIMNLRRKLGIECIETIRGVGYRLAKN